MIADESFHQSRQGCYALTRVHHVDGHTIRVHVARDSYQQQSHAGAEVLTPALTWTSLATTPATEWHATTPLLAAHAGTLAPIAAELLARALRILTSPGTAGT